MKITLTPHAVELIEIIQSRRDEPSGLIVERALELLALDLTVVPPATPAHSILELQGLGKSLWQGMEAQQYVNREREAGNG